MKTLKIEIPKGFEIDNFDTTSGKVTFKEIPKDVTERIKTIDDVLRANGMNQNGFNALTSNLSEDEASYKLLKLIAKSLNEGWEPDWDDSSQYKYQPYFKMGSSGFLFSDDGGWNSYSHVGSRLCFKSRELAIHAGEQFTEVYKKFMLIN